MLTVIRLQAPVVDNTSQPVLDHVIVRVNHSIHVCIKAPRCINTVVVKTDLDVVLWVRAYDKVDVGPVGQQISLDETDDLR